MDKYTIEHLNLYYGNFHGLKDVSLHLPANEVEDNECDDKNNQDNQ